MSYEKAAHAGEQDRPDLAVRRARMGRAATLVSRSKARIAGTVEEVIDSGESHE